MVDYDGLFVAIVSGAVIVCDRRQALYIPSGFPMSLDNLAKAELNSKY